jgi:hypothetical protein
MNTAQKWITIGSACSLLLFVLIPPWQQTCKGAQLGSGGELGHHFVWSAPSLIGGVSPREIGTVSASECEVGIERDVLLSQCGSIVVMTAVLFFAFRKGVSVTIRTLLFTSLSLALCLPVPPPDGAPLALLVVEALSPFTDTGHIPRLAFLMVAGTLLTACSSAAFLVLGGAIWIARRRVRSSLS